MQKKEILEKIKTMIKEDEIINVHSSYLSYTLKQVTSNLLLTDIQKQELWLYCYKNIPIKYTYSKNPTKRIKSTARKWTKAEAEAHGHYYSNEKSSNLANDKKADNQILDSKNKKNSN